jgi:cytoskeletal protein RodZ
MGLLARLHQLWDDGGQDVTQWTREAVEDGALQKRQNGVLVTLALSPPVVISIGLDSNGIPVITATVLDGTTTTPTAVAPTDQTTVAANTPAPAPTTQATQPANTANSVDTPATVAPAPVPSATTNNPANTATCR